MDVLQLIADQSQPPNISALHKMCDLTRPTLYRILASLESEGLISQTPDKHYKLGARLVVLARKVLAENDVRTLARPELEQLRDATGETVHLAIKSGNELVYIDKIESRQIVRMASDIGTRVPFHSTAVGKAYMSALGEQSTDALVTSLNLEKVTQFTTTNPRELLKKVSKARAQKYVFDDQENEIGIVCYGAPILDATGSPAASVSISVPVFRHESETTHYTKPLLAHVGKISELLGY